KGSVIVNYVDELGDKIEDHTENVAVLINADAETGYDTTTETLRPKTLVTTSGKVYELVPVGKYEAGEVDENGRLTDTDEAAGKVEAGKTKEITYVYKLKEEAKGSVIVNYVDELGDKIEDFVDDVPVLTDAEAGTAYNTLTKKLRPKTLVTTSGKVYDLVEVPGKYEAGEVDEEGRLTDTDDSFGHIEAGKTKEITYVYKLREETQPKPKEEGPKEEGPKEEGPKEEGPKEEGPKEEGPKEEGPKEEGPKEEGPKEEGPKEEGPKEEGPKEEGPKEEGPKEEGPKEEGPKEEGPKEEGPKEEGPKEEGPKEEGPKEEGPKEEGPKEEGPKEEGQTPPPVEEKPNKYIPYIPEDPTDPSNPNDPKYPNDPENNPPLDPNGNPIPPVDYDNTPEDPSDNPPLPDIDGYIPVDPEDPSTPLKPVDPNDPSKGYVPPKPVDPKKDTPVPYVPAGTVTVHYVDEEGNVIKDP
ncbi:MucBP domain-containing protein, partial [Aerococcaceae bacterium zg-ZUI334]|uniref:MucBP domain-containing protein n=1 Tax=Aerococcaceae bacterium zg-252 TaxID=2796928 RepID=UPI001B9DB106|nr:MucBP domain-containing protein [Aerococcaceae bacterium zg-ZUI334]